MPDEKPKGVVGDDGRTFFEFGEGWIPLEFIVLAKCLAPDGSVKYRELTSQSLHPVEALGMIETMSDTIRARLMGGAREV